MSYFNEIITKGRSALHVSALLLAASGPGIESALANPSELMTEIRDDETTLPGTSQNIKIYPTAIHEFNTLVGPDLDTLKPVRLANVPLGRKELYQTIGAFMNNYVWQKREPELYGASGEDGELYRGVRLNSQFSSSDGQRIAVITNTAHPAYVTHAGENYFEYWAEEIRQKNLCFVNDLWAALLPEAGKTPSWDFYTVLRRLSQNLLGLESSLDAYPLQPRRSLEDLLKALNKVHDSKVQQQIPNEGAGALGDTPVNLEAPLLYTSLLHYAHQEPATRSHMVSWAAEEPILRPNVFLKKKKWRAFFKKTL